MTHTSMTGGLAPALLGVVVVVVAARKVEKDGGTGTGNGDDDDRSMGGRDTTQTLSALKGRLIEGSPS